MEKVKYTSLGKEIRISPKTLVSIDVLSGIATFALLIKGKEKFIGIMMDKETFEAIKQGEEVTTTTLKEFKKQILK